MNEVTRRETLTEKLDRIDENVAKKAIEGYYQSRMLILLGMWDKGEAISVEFRGVDSTPSYRQLERETGRTDDSIKKWHILYKKYPDRNDYLPVAKEKATAWTSKAITKENKLLIEKPEALPLPEGKYSVIYADPPWQYHVGDQHSKEEQETVLGTHYPSMNIDELCELQIPSAKNAVLFMWATSPLVMSQEAFQVVNAWGFEAKACYVWDKVKHNVGHYNSVRHEFLLICTKGSFMPQSKGLHDSVVSIERTKHSEKPEYFRELIDNMYPGGKRIELFARKKVEGWDCYGDDPVLQG